jgi:GNAT superfamily N-acetyltransferase
LLIDGYDLEPNYGMFWHPPYYRQLFEQYGFQLYFKQYTCYRTTAAPLHPSFAKRAEEHAGAYRFAHGRKQDAEKLAQDFFKVYNLAWARHSGVKPMTLKQARNIVQEMKPVLDERLLWFAYHGDEPVAFFISLPELNQIFKHVGRRLNLWGKLRFVLAKRRFMRRPDKKLFGIIYGVVPEHQGKGVDAAMLVYARQAFIDAGYADIEMNWIGDFNPRMLVTTRSIGATILKSHATYRYLFDRNRPFERCPIIR